MAMPPVPERNRRSAPPAQDASAERPALTAEERRARIAKAGRDFMDANPELLERLAK